MTIAVWCSDDVPLILFCGAIERARSRILPLLPFQSLGIFVLYTRFSPLSCINEDLAIDGGGNLSE